MQIFEILFRSEQKEGFSFEAIRRWLQALEEEKRRPDVNEEAVQVMTLHISKGLEFDVVFALGLITRTPQGDDEIDAEKLRQLYVAMTRAKKRLYLPLVQGQELADEGTWSPIELFERCFEGSLLDECRRLAQSESITVEEISAPYKLGSPVVAVPAPPDHLPGPHLAVKSSYLSSFTALASQKESTELKTLGPEELPRGKETGIVIHTIFEKFFKNGCQNLAAVLDEELRFSPLLEWREAIFQMVDRAMNTSLGDFCLKNITSFQVEAEFLFPSPPNFIKGFIDLLFEYHGKMYILDWKTNWLEDYSLASMQGAIKQHDYGLQAALYKEAVERHFQKECQGAYYFFVRGGAYVIL
jgi:exodeoxyribonuclease V beta subunit